VDKKEEGATSTGIEVPSAPLPSQDVIDKGFSEYPVAVIILVFTIFLIGFVWRLFKTMDSGRQTERDSFLNTLKGERDDMHETIKGQADNAKEAHVVSIETIKDMGEKHTQTLSSVNSQVIELGMKQTEATVGLTSAVSALRESLLREQIEKERDSKK
jgi:hypothetical protein